MATNWLNDDGLYIKFGTNEATPAKGGSFKQFGPVHGNVEFVLTLADLTDAAAIVSDTIKLPDGAQIESIISIAEVAATSGGSATLRIGTIDEDRASNGDDDSLVADQTVASLASAGETSEILAQGTFDGTLVGTILTKSLYVTASYETAAFTAGVARIRINYRMTE